MKLFAPKNQEYFNDVKESLEKRQIGVMLGREITRAIEKTDLNAKEYIKETLERISKYKSEVDSLITIGRQNAINDIDNELNLIEDKQQ